MLFNQKSYVVGVNIKQANMFNGSYMAARLKQANMVKYGSKIKEGQHI